MSKLITFICKYQKKSVPLHVFSTIPNNYLTLIDAINLNSNVDEINPQSNIAKALRETLNSGSLVFGEEIDYDKVYDITVDGSEISKVDIDGFYDTETVSLLDLGSKLGINWLDSYNNRL